jgi:hypothetical protein
MGNLISKKNKYDNKAINFNEKLIQIERDICNEKETDNPIYYIQKYGQPYHIYNDMKIYNSYNFDENKFLYSKDEKGECNYKKVCKAYCWYNLTVFTYKIVMLAERESVLKVIYK